MHPITTIRSTEKNVIATHSLLLFRYSKQCPRWLLRLATELTSVFQLYVGIANTVKSELGLTLMCVLLSFTADLKAFERRLTEYVSCLQPATGRWRSKSCRKHM